MSQNVCNDMSAEVGKMLNQAKAYVDAGQLKAAASIYKHLVRLAPADPNVHHTLGLVYLELRRFDPALFHIGRSIELNSSNSVAYRSMGDALAASRQFSLAIRAYQKACSLDPENTDALLNLGNIFHELDMFDQARQTFHKIISRTPDHIRALNNLGKVYHDTGLLDSAMACYDRCMDLYPEYAEARFNRAALLLALGDFKRGWKEYEWRFKRSSAADVYPHRLSTPRWQGQNYHGRRLLVHCEQGMGDTLQFVRYLPMVKQRGGKLIMEAHAPLVPLFQSLPWIDEMIAFHADRPPVVPHDLHIPLMSLPGIFNTRADTIPNTIPYIGIDVDRAKPWRVNLKTDRLNIGLVWAGSALNPKRNLPIHKCSAWFRNPRFHFVGLQKGEASGQLLKLNGNLSSINELGPYLNDFLDTAAAMIKLDLIISVDTAAAHLAGAMGKPLWVLLPCNADWRWPLYQDNCPWYPRAHIFRQSNPGKWESVIDRVATALRRLTST